MFYHIIYHRTSHLIIIAGWWFGTFFIFPYIGKNHPNWLSYFSRWLKPPTRLFILIPHRTSPGISWKSWTRTGCEATCPVVDHGRCTTCSSPEQCSSVSCPGPRKHRGKRVVLGKKQSKMVKMEKHGGFTMFYMIIMMFCWHQRKNGGWSTHLQNHLSSTKYR